jgi:hypothetical protein
VFVRWHSAKTSLPSARSRALGKVCFKLKKSFPSARSWHSAKKAYVAATAAPCPLTLTHSLFSHTVAVVAPSPSSCPLRRDSPPPSRPLIRRAHTAAAPSPRRFPTPPPPLPRGGSPHRRRTLPSHRPTLPSPVASHHPHPSSAHSIFKVCVCKSLIRVWIIHYMINCNKLSAFRPWGGGGPWTDE